MQHNVLALDLATTTGWARHATGMPRPFLDAFRLPGGTHDIGQRCEALRKFLAFQHQVMPITHVVFEKQLVGHAPKGKASSINMETVRMLSGLGAMAEWFAYRIGAEVYDVDLVTWRKHFLGRGTGWKKKDKDTGEVISQVDPKQLAIQRCEALGWFTDKTDAAEAAGILDYFLHILPGAQIPWRDRLILSGID